MVGRHLFAISAAAMLVFGASSASAQLYSYETPSGEVLITSERHPEYKLLEVLSEGPSARAQRASSASSSNTSPRQAPEADPRLSGAREAARRGLPDSFSAREAYFDDLIEEAALAYDLPFGFIKAVIRVESAFQPHVVSHAGAMGLMQLMPRTAESLGVTNAFDARQNVFGGAKFLRILIERYDGDINLILAAYNAGDVAVRRYDGIPYPQTREYVASVYYWYQLYSAQAETP
ncbi:lytic transglycosylase domain-containing protein [Lujinxingia vulgaris]|uniref:Lytic transglycosylase domain-containing protein n=1 Tax=Lujinxingia vulgaris TaxID=2600176 RepID=A0A5C6XI59_9DELT|nr:lytic transglycosylase domain-containing protein [Lujinxingia vulgaris]TXD37812.1 lytic transglycosylase domain-containing protein [Lujinxingia vulgaris]